MKRRSRKSSAFPTLILLVLLAGAAVYLWTTQSDSKNSITGAVCPTSPSSTTITIASFNTLHLGWNNGKDFDELAAIIACYDVIALQEVMKASALDTLKAKLNTRTATPVWAYVISPLLGTSYREQYAILYRTDRVQHTGRASVFPDPEDRFIREPFYADFQAGQFDFTLITMHAVGPGDETRGDEISGLKGVFSKVQNDSTCENDVILVGDFNTPASDKNWSSFRKISTAANLIPATTKTSLGQSNMSQSYDNIWIQKEFSGREFTGRADAHLYFESIFAGKGNVYSEAKARVSDHVPVWAEFRTDLLDDDGPCP